MILKRNCIDHFFKISKCGNPKMTKSVEPQLLEQIHFLFIPYFTHRDFFLIYRSVFYSMEADRDLVYEANLGSLLYNIFYRAEV